MHTYFNPPLNIRDVGRLLKGDTFSELTEALGDGEVLFELMERPDHVHYAILMDDQETFDEFKRVSVTHPYMRLGYYAVAWSDAEEGTDERVEDWMKS
jgi:hypothetical protein